MSVTGIPVRVIIHNWPESQAGETRTYHAYQAGTWIVQLNRLMSCNLAQNCNTTASTHNIMTQVSSTAQD